MDQRLTELHLKRGRLLEHIAMQRNTLARQVAPLRVALDTADRVIAVVRDTARFVRQHPAGVAALVAVTVVLRPRGVWRWLQRGLLVWRSWHALHRLLPVFKR